MGLFLLKNGSISLTGGRIKKLNNNPPRLNLFPCQISPVRARFSQNNTLKGQCHGIVFC